MKHLKNEKIRLGPLALSLGLWLLSAWILTLILTPWKTLAAQGYLSLSFFHTLLSILSPVFAKALVWTLGILVLAVFLLNRRAQDRPALEKSALLWTFLLPGILLAASVALVVIPRLPRGTDRPNVILIIVDTLRSDYTALSPADPKHTPNMHKALLPDSACFTNAYSTAPWTLPSIASILTSQYPSTLQVSNLVSVLQNKELTLAEILREYGFTTHGIVSHLLLTDRYGLHQGFEGFNTDNISDQYFNHADVSSPGITDDAIAFIRAKGTQPFFLMMHYFDPHYIYLPHDQACPYQGPFTSWDINTLRGLIRSGRFTPQDLAYLTCSYASEIRLTDHHLGRFIEELKRLKLYDSSTIVFVADHGEEFAERGQLGHSTTLYNELIHVPLMIKPPHSKKLASSDQPTVSSLDILPTVLDLADIAIPKGLQGRSLSSPLPQDRAVFSEVNHQDFGRPINMTSVVMGPWKLIHDLENKRYELFDLQSDPQEKNDLMSRLPPPYAGLRIRLRDWEKTFRQNPGQTHAPRKVMTPEEERQLKSLGYL
jgi:arylsulfatase A-like enzyme